jgi:hypothetical protein
VKPLVTEDRGLGVAHERCSLYQRLDTWARTYEIDSMLEGPLDGVDGIAGVHGLGLARRGVNVVAAVPSDEHARLVRDVYAGCGATGEPLVLGQADLPALPRADLVLCYRALDLAADWRSYLAEMAKLARKVVVVVVGNPHNWRLTMTRTLGLGLFRGRAVVPEAWRTEALAPELWKIGRVKEHTHFEAPWWPEAPAGSAREQLRAILGGKPREGYVYGPGRWPHFGGPGWLEELMPALAERPTFGAANEKRRTRTACAHAFVVDVRPRTARERRRLAQLEETTPRPVSS